MILTRLQLLRSVIPQVNSSALVFRPKSFLRAIANIYVFSIVWLTARRRI